MTRGNRKGTYCQEPDGVDGELVIFGVSHGWNLETSSIMDCKSQAWKDRWIVNGGRVW